MEIETINEPQDALDAGCAAGRFMVRKDGAEGWEHDCPRDPVQMILARLGDGMSAFMALCEGHGDEFMREMADHLQVGLLTDLGSAPWGLN